jgi:5-formyltetrahydrofolate cyclo-ligase
MNNDKAELRVRLKRARLELTDAEHTLKSRAIVEELKEATDWSQVKSLHYFEPLHELLEPDIDNFISLLEDNFPDMALFTPRLIDNTWQLIAARGDELPEKFDVVIVPMLGFDNSHNRIGYGGGYYDKFLSTQKNSRKIGVCFKLGQVEKIPIESHDVALDLIVTEEGIVCHLQYWRNSI